MARMGCNTNLEPKTQSCCGCCCCGAAGLTGGARWWLDGRRGERPPVGVMAVVGFFGCCWGTPDLPSGEGGVLCGCGLLVEKMNSVDPFFFQNSRIFYRSN
jgi:hypothetical protein